MSQRILDEREHRRGLVLGLTLAEILILLLFLLLLALGARLSKLEQDKKAAEKEREEVKTALNELRRRFPGGANRLAEGTAKEFATRIRLTIWLEERFPSLADKFDVLTGFVEAGVKVDPSDPPAAIEKAREILKRLGPGSSLAQITALERAVAEREARLPGLGAKPPTTRPLDQPPTLVERTIAVLNARDPGKESEHDWPPIITLSEAKGYTFASGSAEVSAEFQDKLSTRVIDELLAIVGKYRVDVIEVVGHTDEQRFNVRQIKSEPMPPDPFSSTSRPALQLIGRRSNLDTFLIPFLNDKGGSERLTPSDNAGLGLARAASVVRILAKDPRLDKVRILPLSGGQVIQVGDLLSTGSPGDVKERRRIEIRARRSDKSAQGWQSHVSTAPAK